MNMLEKMAKCAHARAQRDFIDLPPWEQMPKEAREQGKEMANAMLYALLEPTEGMLDAVRCPPTEPGVIECFDAPSDQEIYLRCIRAAREGK